MQHGWVFFGAGPQSCVDFGWDPRVCGLHVRLMLVHQLCRHLAWHPCPYLDGGHLVSDFFIFGLPQTCSPRNLVVAE